MAVRLYPAAVTAAQSRPDVDPVDRFESGFMHVLSEKEGAHAEPFKCIYTEFSEFIFN
jgi:hypothetical protein